MKLVLVGESTDGSAYEAEIREFIESNNLQAFVEIQPYTNQIIALLDNVDCLVHATAGTEGFGRVVAEAMARGCPVIVSSNGALPELVENGKAGAIAQTNVDLQSAMIKILSDHRHRAAMSLNARSAAEQFRPGSIANRMMEIYDTLPLRRS